MTVDRRELSYCIDGDTRSVDARVQMQRHPLQPKRSIPTPPEKLKAISCKANGSMLQYCGCYFRPRDPDAESIAATIALGRRSSLKRPHTPPFA